MLVVQLLTTDRRPAKMLPSLNKIVALKVLAVSALVFALPAADAFAGWRIP
jgi:hypothetical protein